MSPPCRPKTDDDQNVEDRQVQIPVSVNHILGMTCCGLDERITARPQHQSPTTLDDLLGVANGIVQDDGLTERFLCPIDLIGGGMWWKFRPELVRQI